MERRTKVLIALAVAVGAGGLTFAGLSVAGQKQYPTVPAPDPAAVAALRVEAFEFAAANGDAHPTGGFVVATTRRAAADVLWPGITVDTDQDVYVVVLEGAFTAASEAPPDAEAPTGNTLVVLYDAATGARLDWGLPTAKPDLSPLGEATPLEP